MINLGLLVATAAALIASHSVDAAPAPAQSATCGSTPYDPAQYTCTNGMLCPGGNLACGTAANFACYVATQYCCVNNGLVVAGSAACASASTPTSTPTSTPPSTTPTTTPTSTPTGPANASGGSLVGTSTSSQCAAQGQTHNFCKAFEDNFNYLDLNVWKHDITMKGGGNWEFEAYTNNRSNSYVKDGVLYLKPTFTSDLIGEGPMLNGGSIDLSGNSIDPNSCTDPGSYGCARSSNGANIINPIQSALIRSANSFSFRYGKVEVVAKLPVGDWIWPAIWMLPKNGAYGQWPSSGEIDIMESRGNAASYPSGGNNQFSSTLHWGPNYFLNRYAQTHKEFTLPSGSFADSFHTFGLIWTPDSIITYIDDPKNVVLNVPLSNMWAAGNFPAGLSNPWAQGCTQAPFDQEFYLVMNVAVGGTNGYFPTAAWSNTSPHAALDFWNAKGSWGPTWQGENTAMKIDKVTVWSLC
ncbi:hypothetical protein HK101_002623 [Irineochytrium annulatum]|nr:hypothetical protein HK101_002623 [Irineochytrium annulatum]